MEKKIFAILLVILMSTNSCSQTKTEWKITAKGIGNIELGNSITETINELNKIYRTEKSMFNTYPVYEKGKKEEIMLISPFIKSDTIASIRIYTEKWKTEDGLKKGLSIKEINQFYNDFFLEYDNNSGSEYFYKIQKFSKNGKEYKSITKFHFIGPTPDYLGNYTFNKKIGRYDKSTDNNEQGILNFIEIDLIK